MCVYQINVYNINQMNWYIYIYCMYLFIYTTVPSGPRIWLAERSSIFMWYGNSNRFTVCITPLVVFLTGSVMADAQIHYDFINKTVFVSRNVVLRECSFFILTRMYLCRLQICSLLIKIMFIWQFASTFLEMWASGRQGPRLSQIFWNLLLALMSL